MRWILSGAIVLWALPVGTAAAATVTSETRTFTDRAGAYQVQFVRFAGLPGETNRLTIGYEGDFGVRLHDPAGITSSAPCVARDAYTTVCPPLGAADVTALLGDGDDTLIGVPLEERVPRVRGEGGEGDDVLSVKNGDLTGGPGDDRLTGDRVDGGTGADVLHGNTLTYANRTAGVTIDLLAGVAGEPGENDQVLPGAELIEGGSGPDVIRAASGHVWIEAGAGDDVVDGSPQFDTLIGGPGADVLRGNDGSDDLLDLDGTERNRLEGGAGNDRMHGGAGADTLVGGAGRDVLHAGAGADVLLTRDGERDITDCDDWDGYAQRLQGDRAVVDAHDVTNWCERIERSGGGRLELHAVERAGAHGLRLVVSCSGRRTCAGRVEVRGDRRRTVVRGRRAVRVAAGAYLRLPVRLDRRVTTRRFEFGVRLVTHGGRVQQMTLGPARR